MKIYKRRRQGAGFMVLASLVIVALGALLFFGIDPSGRENLRVERLDSPKLAQPPTVTDEVAAVEEPEERQPEAVNDEPKEEPKQGSREESKPEEPKEAAIPEPASSELYLTVPKMGLYDNFVANGVDDATLMNGAGKTPESANPWDDNANPYIAAHVLGYSGTGSYMQFAALPNMTYGDEIMLTDANGTVYTYQVTEILQVGIPDNWVTAPIAGKDMVSLQTCINPPAYDVRLVVRGERVSVDPA